MLILVSCFRARISGKVCVNNQINHGIGLDYKHMKWKYNGETLIIYENQHTSNARYI